MSLNQTAHGTPLATEGGSRVLYEFNYISASVTPKSFRGIQSIQLFRLLSMKIMFPDSSLYLNAELDACGSRAIAIANEFEGHTQRNLIDKMYTSFSYFGFIHTYKKRPFKCSLQLYLYPPHVPSIWSWSQGSSQLTVGDRYIHYIWFDNVPADTKYDSWIHKLYMHNILHDWSRTLNDLYIATNIYIALQYNDNTHRSYPLAQSVFKTEIMGEYLLHGSGFKNIWFVIHVYSLRNF